MMRIYSLFFAIVLTLNITNIYATQYKYIRGNAIYEIKETSQNYEVICKRYNNNSALPQNRNIADRQFRMTAIDLIGAYIVYLESYSDKFDVNLFQIIVDGIDLHYNATIDGISSKVIRGSDGASAVIYNCPKNNYKLTNAEYNKDIDVSKLILKNYLQNKNENTSAMLYRYGNHSNAGDYIQMEIDFLSGKASLPIGVHRLQNNLDRFELSIFSDEELPRSTIDTVIRNKPTSKPYTIFWLEELITSVPLTLKNYYYKQWQKELDRDGSLWENVLCFCTQYINKENLDEDIGLCDVISQYVGAISPYGIRSPINNSNYLKAANAYANLDFELAINILTESINTEGISAQALNLLGASYRLIDKPHIALAYLLLCFKLNPKTEYLTGNLALCLNILKYPQINDLCQLLYTYTIDDWSKTELLKICKYDSQANNPQNH